MDSPISSLPMDLMPNDSRTAAFSDEQRRYWSEVDRDHFEWQTGNPYIAETERQLLASLQVHPGERFLEVGCGEGANLRNAPQPPSGARRFAIDFSLPKVRFARERGLAIVVRAEATTLPFRTGSFDAVLIRDLLHHVVDRALVLREAHRVLRRGGRVMVLEPNGRNPLMAAIGLAIRAERGALRSTRAATEKEMRLAGFEEIEGGPRQALPISRLLLHYRVGFPRIATARSVRALLAGTERLAERVVPRSMWAYFLLRGKRSAG